MPQILSDLFTSGVFERVLFFQQKLLSLFSGVSRGIGGIFFDDLDEDSAENTFQFAKVLVLP